MDNQPSDPLDPSASQTLIRSEKSASGDASPTLVQPPRSSTLAQSGQTAAQPVLNPGYQTSPGFSTPAQSGQTAAQPVLNPGYQTPPGFSTPAQSGQTAAQPVLNPGYQSFQPPPPQFSEKRPGGLLEDRTTSLLPSSSQKVRQWFRSPAGRIVLPLVALLIGIVAGISSIFWYGLSGAGPVISGAKAGSGNLVVDANKSFVMQLVQGDLKKANLPGQVENVTVTLQPGAQMIVAGDDVYSFLGVQLSRHFTIYVQPYVQSCVLQIRVTQANLGGIPVTGFVQTFEGNINQQLSKKPAGLPQGFAYCTVAVRTAPGDMFITYVATPLG